MRRRGFEVVADSFRKHPIRNIHLPKRGSRTSAGYDFYTPIGITLNPGEKVTIWTDIKAYMKEQEVLKIYIRSSIGINKGLVLANGTGIIDQDYYSNPSNDGNIGICLFNSSKGLVTIEKQERIAQGIFIPFLPADNGNTDSERIGGHGSTGEK